MSKDERDRQRLMNTLQRELEQRQAAQANARVREAAMPVWRQRLQTLLRSRLTRILLPSLIVLGIVGTFVGWFGVNALDRVNMDDTVKRFCSAEANGNYSGAYQFVSARVRQSLSSSAFETASRQSHISGCSLAQNGASAQIVDNRSIIAVSYLVNDGATNTVTDKYGSMTLVREDGGWRIDHITNSAVVLF